MNDLLSATFTPLMLPEDFTTLLKSNMNGKLGSYQGFGQFVLSSLPLKSIFDTEFLDIDSEGRFDIIFKSLGWEGIKLRLFDFYREQGVREFAALDEVLIEELLTIFESRYKPFVVEGYSRHSLLFFYSTLLPDTTIRDEFWHYLMSRETMGYLKFFEKRSIYIDILLLSLFIFETYLGKEQVLSTLPLQNYEALYTQLTVEQKCEFQRVLLHYCFSIRDDLFHEDNI